MIYDSMMSAMAGAIHTEMQKTSKHTGETTKELESLRGEVVSLRAELDSSNQRLADHISRQEEQRKADTVQAEIDKKKQLRHEYKVTAFSVLLTLAIEHFFDLMKLAQSLVDLVLSFFH